MSKQTSTAHRGICHHANRGFGGFWDPQTIPPLREYRRCPHVNEPNVLRTIRLALTTVIPQTTSVTPEEDKSLLLFYSIFSARCYRKVSMFSENEQRATIHNGKKPQMTARYLKQYKHNWTTEGILINQVHHWNPQSVTAPCHHHLLCRHCYSAEERKLAALLHQWICFTKRRGKQVLQPEAFLNEHSHRPCSFQGAESLPQSFLLCFISNSPNPHAQPTNICFKFLIIIYKEKKITYAIVFSSRRNLNFSGKHDYQKGCYVRRKETSPFLWSNCSGEEQTARHVAYPLHAASSQRSIRNFQ